MPTCRDSQCEILPIWKLLNTYFTMSFDYSLRVKKRRLAYLMADERQAEEYRLSDGSSQLFAYKSGYFFFQVLQRSFPFHGGTILLLPLLIICQVLGLSDLTFQPEWHKHIVWGTDRFRTEKNTSVSFKDTSVSVNTALKMETHLSCVLIVIITSKAGQKITSKFDLIPKSNTLVFFQLSWISSNLLRISLKLSIIHGLNHRKCQRMRKKLLHKIQVSGAGRKIDVCLFSSVPSLGLGTSLKKPQHSPLYFIFFLVDFVKKFLICFIYSLEISFKVSVQTINVPLCLS